MQLSKKLGLSTAACLAAAALQFAACDPESPEPVYERALEGNERLNGDNQVETAFELDGNAMDAQETPGVDWSTIQGEGIAAAEFAKAMVFLADPAPHSTFSGGGSKDTQDLGNWRYKDGSVPDKDDITNAYAAAYNNPHGDLIIYFGADRYANNGDALLGFWFFQDQVKLGNNGRFQGTHKDGDLLILANFSKGGSVAEIKALEWINGSLIELDSSNAGCDSGAATNQCAITNTETTESPWNYVGKGAQGDGPFPPGTFFEGPVNITKLFQKNNEPMPCFASFMAETRSSTSITATLKDFAIGSFPVCGLGISAKCDASTLNLSQDGFVHKFSGSVTNSGLGTVYDVTVTVSEGEDQAVVKLGELHPGANKPFAVEIDSVENSATIAATVTASTAGPNGAHDLESSLASQPSCAAPVHNPAISLHNTCTMEHELLDGKLVVAAEHQRWVCNDTPIPEGEQASLSMNIEIMDLGTNSVIETFDAVPAGECRQFTTHEYPSSLNISRNLRATGKTALYPNVDLVSEKQANCSLCQ